MPGRTELPPIPDPLVRPTMTIEEAGRYLGLNRSAAYRAAERGTIPTIHLSERKIAVPTAALRRMLQIDT